MHPARTTHARRRTTGGFTLVGAIVSTAMVAVVFAGLAGVFTYALRMMPAQAAAQNAARIATSELAVARSAGPSGIMHGRDSTTVATQYANASPAAAALLGPQAAQVTDPSAPAGTGATKCQAGEHLGCAFIPAVPATTETGDVTYTVTTFALHCATPASFSAATTCTPGASPGGQIPFVRLVVDVAWPGISCGAGPDGICHYVATALVGEQL